MRNWISQNIHDGDVRIKEDQASVSGTSGGGLGQGGGAFRLELRGNNMKDLIAASEKAENMLKNGDYGVTDVSSTYQEGLPELSIIPDRDKLKYYGVTVGSLYDTLSSAISGSGGGVLPNDVKNNGNDTDINVYFNGGESYRKSDLAAIPVETKKEWFTYLMWLRSKMKKGLSPSTAPTSSGPSLSAAIPAAVP